MSNVIFEATQLYVIHENVGEDVLGKPLTKRLVDLLGEINRPEPKARRKKRGRKK
jgi:hypothetical protein